MKKFNSLKIFTTIPIYLFLILLVLIPALYIGAVSLLKSGGTGSVIAVITTENYTRLFNPLYASVIINSIIIAGITTVLTLVLSIPLSFAIENTHKKYRLMFFLMIIMPYWTNSLVRTYAFMAILRADGLINRLLMFLHITDSPVKLLYTQGATLAAMIYLLLPVMFLPVYSSVEKLDKSLTEASRDLGASPVTTFLKITVPQILPGIIAGCILVFTPCLGLFFISDLVGGGKVVLLGNLIRDQFTVTRNLPAGSALSVIMMFMSLIFIFAYTKIGRQEEK